MSLFQIAFKMKHKLLFLICLAVLLIFSGCGQKSTETTNLTPDDNTCVIKGKIIGLDLSNKATVELEDQWDHAKILATAPVKDGEFAMAVPVKEMNHVVLYCVDNDDAYQMRDFLLEPGEIVIEGSPDDYEDLIGCTPMNDRFKRFVAEAETDDTQEARLFEAFLKENPQPELILRILQYVQLNPAYELEIFQSLPENLQNKESYTRPIKEDFYNNAKYFAKGMPFHDLEGQTPDGKRVKLADYMGKKPITIINYWATWCGFCIEEMPELALIAEKYGDSVNIVGVDVREPMKAEKLQAFINEKGMTWPIITDVDEISNAYITSIPVNAIYDKDGLLIEKVQGYRENKLTRHLEKILE